VIFSCVWALVASIAYGQAVQTQAGTRSYELNKTNVDGAIARVKSGNFLAVDVDMIRRGGAVEAIPILKEQFVRVREPLLKGKIASVLVSLGSKDDSYWDFLVRLAAPALESDAPDFMSYDSQGRSKPGPSPEFAAWAKGHDVTPNGPNGTAAEDSVYIFPAEVALLGTTRDPRAIPLLRRGLLSPNHMRAAPPFAVFEGRDKDSAKANRGRLAPPWGAGPPFAALCEGWEPRVYRLRNRTIRPRAHFLSEFLRVSVPPWWM